LNDDLSLNHTKIKLARMSEGNGEWKKKSKQGTNISRKNKNQKISYKKVVEKDTSEGLLHQIRSSDLHSSEIHSLTLKLFEKYKENPQNELDFLQEVSLVIEAVQNRKIEIGFILDEILNSNLKSYIELLDKEKKDLLIPPILSTMQDLNLKRKKKEEDSKIRKNSGKSTVGRGFGFYNSKKFIKKPSGIEDEEKKAEESKEKKEEEKKEILEKEEEDFPKSETKELCSCLRLLAHICYENQELKEHDESIYQQILPLCSKSVPLKISRLAINCLANLILKYPDSLKPHANLIFQTLAQYFVFIYDHMNLKSQHTLKFLYVNLRALTFVFPQIKYLTDLATSKVFFKMYQLLFMGTEFAAVKFDNLMQITKDPATALLSDISSSDAEDLYPKSEADPFLRIKSLALQCLQNLFKISAKYIFNYWHILIPRFIFKPPSSAGSLSSTPSYSWFESFFVSQSREPNLITLFLTASDNKYKVGLLLSIAMLIEHSPIQKWLGPLETDILLPVNKPGGEVMQKDKQMSRGLIAKSAASRESKFIRTGTGGTRFTTISETLGSIVRYLHYLLLYCLNKEQNTTVRAQVLKTIASMVTVCPYEKMFHGLLTQIFIPHIQAIAFQMLSQTQQQLFPQKIAALNCFAAAFSHPKVKEEVYEVFLTEDNIIEQILNNYENELVFQTLDCVVLLMKVAKFYPQFLFSKWEKLQLYLTFMLGKNEKKITLNSLKLIEEFLKNYNKSKEEDVEEKGTQEEEEKEIVGAKMSKKENIFENENVCSFLDNLFLSNLESASQKGVNSDTAVLILNILCILTESQWNYFPPKEKLDGYLECIFIVKDPGLLKGIAIKLLGTLVSYEKFKYNSIFMKSVFDKIAENAVDKNISVALKNSWALANISSSVTAKLQSLWETDSAAPPLSWKSILQIAVDYAQFNKEKIVSNGIRAMGCIFKNINLDTQPDSLAQSPLFRDSCLLLIAKIMHKSPKVCWNSCVAIGNAIQNNTLPSANCVFFKNDVFTKLASVILNRQNFKAKIHAVQTLSYYKHLSWFAESYFKIWDSLINAYKNMDHVEDFTEYQYLETLEYAIINTMSHLFLILDDKENAKFISNFLNYNSSEILQILTIFLQHRLQISGGLSFAPKLFKIEEIVSMKELLQNKNLEIVILEIKKMCAKILNLIENYEETHVSFGIVEQLNELAKGELENYRDLPSLQIIQSTEFIKSFS
jgi:hypothetical protein